MRILLAISFLAFSPAACPLGGPPADDDDEIVDTSLCNDSCQYDGDGDCDDGGPGSDFDYCDYGSDCTDCGTRDALADDDDATVDDDDGVDDDDAVSDDDDVTVAPDNAYYDPATGYSWFNPRQFSPNQRGSTLNGDGPPFCNQLDFEGYSDWRLPTVTELRTLIRTCPDTMPGGACQVGDGCLTEDCETSACNGCSTEGTDLPPEIQDFELGFHLTANRVADKSDRAWLMWGMDGSIVNGQDNQVGCFRCVRGP
jgi:hypothetical protein